MSRPSATRPGGLLKGTLAFEQGSADRRQHRNLGGTRTSLLAADNVTDVRSLQQHAGVVGAFDEFDRQTGGQDGDPFSVVQSNPPDFREMRRHTIKRPGIKQMPAEPGLDEARQRALASATRAVDGNDRCGR